MRHFSDRLTLTLLPSVMYEHQMLSASNRRNTHFNLHSLREVPSSPSVSNGRSTEPGTRFSHRSALGATAQRGTREAGRARQRKMLLTQEMVPKNSHMSKPLKPASEHTITCRRNMSHRGGATGRYMSLSLTALSLPFENGDGEGGSPDAFAGTLNA
jgi:hypothetical protein